MVGARAGRGASQGPLAAMSPRPAWCLCFAARTWNHAGDLPATQVRDHESRGPPSTPLGPASSRPAMSVAGCGAGDTDGNPARRRRFRCSDRAPDSVHALRQHRVGDLYEAADVGTVDVVDRAVLALAVAHAIGVDVLHDHVQALVALGLGPR